MSMKISKVNQGMIIQAIKDVEGKAYKWTLEYDELIGLIERLEVILTTRHKLPKRMWEGLIFNIGNAAIVGKAYNGIPMSTVVTVKRKSNSWAIEKIQRARLYHDIEPINLHYPEIAGKIAAYIASNIHYPRMWA